MKKDASVPRLIRAALKAHPEGLTGVQLVKEIQEWRALTKSNILIRLSKMVKNREVAKVVSECWECQRPTVHYKLTRIIIDETETSTY